MKYAPVLLLAASMICGSATAQDIPQQRSVSVDILATNTPNEKGTYSSWPKLTFTEIDWKQRIYTEVDALDKRNNLLTGFGAAIMDAINSGKMVAYSAKDDRFTTVLTKEEVNTLLGSLAIEEPVVNADGAPVAVRRSPFNTAAISKYKIKEDSMQLLNGNKVVRIMGIAPIAKAVDANGQANERELFWIYYIESLNYLATVEAINGYTWADVLESRAFYGTVVKRGNSWTRTPTVKVK